MSALAVNLLREVRPDFFRVLAGPLARLYIDALDSLEREAGQRSHGLDREEALALVEQVIEQHEDLANAGEETVLSSATNRDRARAVLDTLRTAGWLQEEERSDWQRLVLFDPNGDATRNACEPNGWIALHYPEILVVDTGSALNGPQELIKFDLQNSATYPVYRNNLQAI